MTQTLVIGWDAPHPWGGFLNIETMTFQGWDVVDTSTHLEEDDVDTARVELGRRPRGSQHRNDRNDTTRNL